MLSPLRNRFGIPGVISVIALVFAMFGGAYAATNSNDGGKATAISIPRDTYVPIPDYQDDKINAAYGVTKLKTMQRLQSEGVNDLADMDLQDLLAAFNDEGDAD